MCKKYTFTHIKVVRPGCAIAKHCQRSTPFFVVYGID